MAKGKGLSKGAKIGIGIGVPVIVIVLVVVIVAIVLFGGSSVAFDGIMAEIYCVGDLQQVPDDISTITTKDNAKIWSIEDMIAEASNGTISIDDLKNPEAFAALEDDEKADIVSWIYRTAVANYTIIPYTAWLLDTISIVDAKDTSMFGDVTVGVRSPYTVINGENGYFHQNTAGIIGFKLAGDKEVSSTITNLFGYNVQEFSNSNFAASRVGKNPASFYSGDLGQKHILGAYCEQFAKAKTTVKYSDTAATADEAVSIGNPWEYLPDAEGTYAGAGWAMYDVDPSYLDVNNTTISYDETSKKFIINFVFNEEDVDYAGAKSKATLERDTKDYITLKDPMYTKCVNTLEVHESGLITKWAKTEVLESGSAKIIGGISAASGSATNDAVNVFSYSKEDTDALAYVARYFSELGNVATVKAPYTLDISGYKVLDNFKPVIKDEYLLEQERKATKARNDYINERLGIFEETK